MRWLLRRCAFGTWPWSWVAAATVGSSLLALGCDSSTAPAPEAPVSIDTEFEGASLGGWTSQGHDAASFSIRHDTNAATRLFFSFRATQARGREVSMTVENALSILSASTWAYTRPVVSSDAGQTWTRISDASLTLPITGADQTAAGFTFRHTLGSDSDWIALKLPYNFSKWLALSEEIGEEPFVSSIEVIGRSLDDNPLHLVTITDASVPAGEKTAIWVLARQHPGEPGGSYMVEGFIRWLLGGSAQAAELLRRAEVFLLPFMNPDGVLAGNQRVNLAGLDINRQWLNTDPSAAPTVGAAQERILEYRDAGGTTRVLIDFHSAPTARSNFFFYSEAAVTSPELHAEVVELITLSGELNPDFDDLAGSVTAVPSDISPRARGWAFDELGTHGLTVESSGNDVTYGPNAGIQQTVERLLALGETVGKAVAQQLYGIP